MLLFVHTHHMHGYCPTVIMIFMNILCSMIKYVFIFSMTQLNLLGFLCYIIPNNTKVMQPGLEEGWVILIGQWINVQISS